MDEIQKSLHNNASPLAKKSISQDLDPVNDPLEEIINIFEPEAIKIEAKPLSDEKLREFKDCYNYIMHSFEPKPLHNIKPCVAYVLLNGLQDGWRISAPFIAAECLRVYDNDLEKAFELLKLFYINSKKKKTRTLKHLQDALKWCQRKNIKISCETLSRFLPCVGNQKVCYTIRGIRTGAKVEDLELGSFKLAENQEALYLRRFFEEYAPKLSPKAIKIYFFLLKKALGFGFKTLFISHKEICQGIGIKYYGWRAITPYLKELKQANLIYYKPGSLKKVKRGNKTFNEASEIKVLDITGRYQNKAEELFKKLFKN